MGERADLHRRLIDAHERGEPDRLARLYRQAGDRAVGDGDEDAACFYYTHAYVFALQGGLEAAGEILAILKRYGRE